ncbi:MAG: hypothetical protein IJE23_06430 [Tyzzerella sp.]|nr:hypothetical protein [Tyzzerella sp.]
MREVLLVLAVLLLFGYVYILMGKLDRFLSENRKSIEEKSEKTEPSRIMLTNDLSDEEILNEIRQFCVKHKNARIVIFDDMDARDET